MRAIDTNVLIRVVTRDDLSQSLRARTLVSENEILLCATVLLEAEWVLRSVYGLAPAAIAVAFRRFCGLETVTVEQPDRVELALQWFEGGCDFADALHLAGSGDCEAFATFDGGLAKAAPQGWTVRLV